MTELKLDELVIGCELTAFLPLGTNALIAQVPRIHFQSGPSSFRVPLPHEGRPGPWPRLQVHPTGGQCLYCSCGTDDL